MKGCFDEEKFSKHDVQHHANILSDYVSFQDNDGYLYFTIDGESLICHREQTKDSPLNEFHEFRYMMVPEGASDILYFAVLFKDSYAELIPFVHPTCSLTVEHIESLANAIKSLEGFKSHLKHNASPEQNALQSLNLKLDEPPSQLSLAPQGGSLSLYKALKGGRSQALKPSTVMKKEFSYLNRARQTTTKGPAPKRWL